MSPITITIFLLVVACKTVSGEGWWFMDKDQNVGKVKSPVVIVPGTGGNRLEARLTGKPSKVAWYCSSKTSHYFTLWLHIKSLLPFTINCWQDNMRLVYNQDNLQVSNSPGVVTRVPGFGKTDTVETLDTDGWVKYMKPLIDFLVSIGYTRNKNVRAAPYDFRYAPSQMPHDYYNKLKALIESSYNDNGRQKVSLISHSYGCPVTMYFLNKMTQDWKSKYLQQWITISGVFGGTLKEVLLYASGDTFGIPSVLVNPLKVRHEQRTCTSNLMMLPSPKVWSKNQVLVRTAKRTYTVGQIDDFLKDVGFPEGVPMRRKLGDLYQYIKAPGVPVHCYYANTPKSTEETLIYGNGEFPDEQPETVKGDGDGTVNLLSLKLCNMFNKLQSLRFQVSEIKGESHNGILGNEEALELLKSDLFI